MNSGIYSIINLANGKTYYGSSHNVYCRWSDHKHCLIHNKHNNTHLQNAWNKYGEKSFKFQLIEEVPVEQLLDIEQKYLDIVKETPQLYYNTAMCATAPMRGLTHSDETKAKMSESRSGCNNVNWGKELSDEHKEKLSQSHKGQVSGNKGKKASKETILKLKLSHIGQIPAMSGKCHSEESKRKMSESSKRLWTDEYRKRMSDAHKGKRKNI